MQAMRISGSPNASVLAINVSIKIKSGLITKKSVKLIIPIVTNESLKPITIGYMPIQRM